MMKKPFFCKSQKQLLRPVCSTDTVSILIMTFLIIMTLLIMTIPNTLNTSDINFNDIAYNRFFLLISEFT
jgi:hypothetical protein